VEAERCFRSVAHPGEASAALVRSRAMVRPLVVTFVPVMVAALAATLAGQRIWPHLFWSAGVALTLAWGWAEFQMRRTPAEVLVRSAQQAAAVRSVHGILRGDAPNWQPLVRARPERMPAALRLSLGDRTHRLLGHRWPRLDALEDALQRALHVS
jgi:hypothetical protein